MLLKWQIINKDHIIYDSFEVIRNSSGLWWFSNAFTVPMLCGISDLRRISGLGLVCDAIVPFLDWPWNMNISHYII